MNVLVFLMPVSLGLGLLGLLAFIWSLKTKQYEDLAGIAERILMDMKPSVHSGNYTSQSDKNHKV
ncbi:MAG: cbb3-type cytochrome oxidase assembly protein CcoS [Boseongicola sp.]|nr:MAG: cbb3-type cytochrome oxidase assembly protein CcoS [Boseongicola sp.]